MSNATYRLEPLVFPSSFMLDSPWFEGWGVDLWAARDSYRYGISVPDEDPPGNQVTTRVQKLLLLSHSLQRFALMLTPRASPVSLSLQGYSPRPFLLHSSNTACSVHHLSCLSRQLYFI